MGEYKRRVWLGAVMILFLLAGVCTPAPILADNPKTLALSNPVPDLVIETITWSPETPLIGKAVTFTVTIGNRGSAKADSSHVAYYIDDVFQASASVDKIDPGATATETFTWTAQVGLHTVKAVADSTKCVPESDETNNDTTFAFSVQAPDLVIETITWSPENPSTGDQVDFTVTVRNQGNSSSRFSHVGLYIDGSSRGNKEVPRIEAGATMTATFSWTAQVGEHTVEAIADVLNQVTEADEANNDRTVTYATAAPDLIIDTITFLPADPSESTLVTFTVTIKNQGSGNADPSYVAYYVNDIYQSSTYVTQISAGATVTKTFNWTMDSDTYTFGAVADYQSKVIESDETNNARTVVLPTIAPDLIVQDINWSPLTPLIAHRITFTITLMNQGKTEACATILYFSIDDYYEWQLEVPEINAGATATRSLEWTTKMDSHKIQAIVDGENSVIESDESNNVKTVTLATSKPASPDLVVTDITWSPENPSIGNEVTFSVSVKNQGSGQTRPFHVAYYVDNTCLASDYVDPVDTGATVTQDFVWTAQAGSHTLKVVADQNESVSESDETNNEKVVTISTPSPDLIVQGITWSPGNPSVGDEVAFTVSIKNQGSVRASHSSVAYYVDGSSRGYHNIQEIDAGAAATTTFTWTSQEGSHVIKVAADMENQVPENEESNNERTVTLPAPDFVIQDITWLPASPSENATMTFMVTMENQGGGSADASSVCFYIDGSSEGCESLEKMEAGAKVTKTFVWKAGAGSHTVKAVADEENQVTESDEYNNEKSLDFSTLPPEPPPVSESTPIFITSLEEQEACVRLQDLSSSVPLGADIVFNLYAVNTATNPVMTVQFVMQVPAGLSVLSSEFIKGDKERYSASYSLEAGEIREIEVRLRADKEGSFNIMGDLSYHFAEDESTAEHQILTLPVTVGIDRSSEKKSTLDQLPLKGVWQSWWFLPAVVILLGIVIFFVLRSRRQAH